MGGFSPDKVACVELGLDDQKIQELTEPGSQSATSRQMLQPSCVVCALAAEQRPFLRLRRHSVNSSHPPKNSLEFLTQPRFAGRWVSGPASGPDVHI